MSYPLFKDYDTTNSSFEEEALRSNTGQNELTDVFFSKRNVDALQEAIRYQVYVRSNQKHVIDRQSDVELKVVMRGTYLEHARNAPYDILSQVKDLNSIVIEYCVDKILSEINMYLYYMNDISTNREPMARSVATTSAGSKTLIMKEF